MYIKQFVRGFERVPHPMHPDRTVARPQLVPVPDVGPFSYTDSFGDRRVVEPDANGWFDVDHDVALAHLTTRDPDGRGWYSEAQVGEELRLGRLDGHAGPVRETQSEARPKRARSTAE